MSRKDTSKKTTRPADLVNSLHPPNCLLEEVSTGGSVLDQTKQGKISLRKLWYSEREHYHDLDIYKIIYTSASGTALALAQSLI